MFSFHRCRKRYTRFARITRITRIAKIRRSRRMRDRSPRSGNGSLRSGIAALISIPFARDSTPAEDALSPVCSLMSASSPLAVRQFCRRPAGSRSNARGTFINSAPRPRSAPSAAACNRTSARSAAPARQQWRLWPLPPLTGIEVSHIPLRRTDGQCVKFLLVPSGGISKVNLADGTRHEGVTGPAPRRSRRSIAHFREQLHNLPPPGSYFLYVLVDVVELAAQRFDHRRA